MRLVFISLFLIINIQVAASKSTSALVRRLDILSGNTQLNRDCYSTLRKLPGKHQDAKLIRACNQVKQLKSCVSEQGRDIYHFDRGKVSKKGKRILTFALIHGDETSGGSIARSWMERLVDLNPRNAWRIVPVLNPDGHLKRSRTNINGVDINRNFPTKKWDKLAHKFWKKRYKGSKRKFPGQAAASEKETLCAIEHFEDFKPDLVIAIHTPYGILDFDGPRVNFPKYKGLPWRRLGNYPGSMGRYMWKDNKVPVLTIELKGADAIKSFKAIDKLQDVSGLLAIRATSNKKKNSKK